MSQERRLVTRRRALGGAAAAGLAAYGVDRLLEGTSPPSVEPVISVRDLGAHGDGVANDTRAFQLAAARIEAAGGGTIQIPRGVYLVGRQTRGASGAGQFAYVGEPVLRISGCRRPVVVRGPGAILRTAPGLRFGAFDPTTGTAYQPPAMPFLNPGYIASIYEGALHFEANRSVHVSGVELDGNIDEIAFGGQYGDAGFQVPHDGLVAIANYHLVVEDVFIHHHGRDGIMVSHPNLAVAEPARPVELHRVRSEYNGRQGLSWTGGRGLRAQGCSFSYTGQSRIPVSNPGAGVDIEPENSICRDGHFSDCRFIANRGFGVVANAGDSAQVTFERCQVQSWSGSAASPAPVALWPNRPGLSFIDCDIQGSLVHTYGAADATQASRFSGCRFDDTVQSGYGAPYFGVAMIEAGGANVQFDACQITAGAHRSIVLEPTVLAPGPAVISGCRIMHRDASLPGGSYQASLNSVRIGDTTFDETGLTQPYFIGAQGVIVEAGVRVSGPHVAWQRPGGPTGTIS